jgi:hypothetical protein
LESSWVWNAWWVSGSLNPVRLCARMLVPRGLETHLLIYPGSFPTLTHTTALDTEGYPFTPTPWFAVFGPGFPYNVPCDQSRLP